MLVGTKARSLLIFQEALLNMLANLRCPNLDDERVPLDSEGLQSCLKLRHAPAHVVLLGLRLSLRITAGWALKQAWSCYE